MGSLEMEIDRTRRPLAVSWRRREHHCKQQRIEITRGKRRLLAARPLARSMRERNDKRKAVSPRVRPTTQRGRSRLVGGRGLKKRVTSKKHVPSFKAEKGREGEAHFNCYGRGVSHISHSMPCLCIRIITEIANEATRHVLILLHYSPSSSDRAVRPSSLRAFRMKVFSSELEHCGESEQVGRASR